MLFVRGEESGKGGGAGGRNFGDSQGWLTLLHSTPPFSIPSSGKLNSPSLSSDCEAAVRVPEHDSVCVCQPWSPMSLSTGGGMLGITVLPVPAVRYPATPGPVR